MSRQGKARPRTVKNVKDFWNKEAQEWGDDPRVTIRDHHFRLLEIATVCNHIKGGREVLDIGCGSGFSTLFYAQAVHNIIGADYAEKMVAHARRFLKDKAYRNRTLQEYAPGARIAGVDNIRFESGNILDLGYPDEQFDKIVAERVLINLPTRELQADAVAEVARVMKPGATWVMVEVTEQGHAGVDRLRKKFGLSIIEKYWHNLYIDEPWFAKVAEREGLVIKAVRRFETYQFMTKVVHPLVVAPAEPKFMAGFNVAAREVAREYPDFAGVRKIGLDRFMKRVFRGALKKHDPAKLSAYDAIVPAILRAKPDFTGCSHQVLFLLRKK